jgi:hypothetical protein
MPLVTPTTTPAELDDRGAPPGRIPGGAEGGEEPKTGGPAAERGAA